jgi:glycosyltransferase involved in cell wall biosynthesis
VTVASRAVAGTSFVVPIHQGAGTLSACLDAILAQRHAGPIELIVVDDGSSDASLEILDRHAGDARVRVRRGARRGAAAAINRGIEAARHPFVAQVDQDVVVEEGWLERLRQSLDDPAVAAAQGVYRAPRGSPFWARLAGADLRQRYGRHGEVEIAVDHVCTGNTVYRRAALLAIGGFDPRLGYGYDNDVSYRLRDAGHRLVRRGDARSLHHWPATFGGYLAQQYGQGYGRLDLVAKHPRRFRGDDVSGTLMMARGPATALALATFLLATVIAAEGGRWEAVSLIALAVLAALTIERAIAGVMAYRATGETAALAFPFAHLARDVCWATAIADWCLRRSLRVPGEPRWSMPRQRGSSTALLRPRVLRTASAAADRVLVLIPAHNEAASLGFVVAEVRACCPEADVLVVDDGSTDSTPQLLARLGVRRLRLPQHLGLGSAMRAGLRYARWLGYRHVVRLDGDGQHDPAQLRRLIGPIRHGACDAVRGSRYLGDSGYRSPAWRRVGQRALASILSRLTRHRVTDPTSGFWAFGPRAVELLADHHPTDYPEPELSLFLDRNRLETTEVAVTMRARRSGSSSFTLARGLVAAGRVALAVIVVPWRAQIEVGTRD